MRHEFSEPIAPAKEAARLKRLTNPTSSASAPVTDATVIRRLISMI